MAWEMGDLIMRYGLSHELGWLRVPFEVCSRAYGLVTADPNVVCLMWVGA